MASLAAKLFSSVFILVGAAILLFGLRDLWRAYASTSWPTVEGKVVSSSVDATRGSKGGTNYYAEIRFDYEVGGVKQSSNNIGFDGYGSSDPSRAQSVVNKYPVGSQVLVHYSPGNPADAVLEPGIHGASFFLPVFGAVFLLAGLAAFKYASAALR